ncbi:ABC transporter permease [Nesterenkonia alba]|uniref:ABC transporter permease n=1 Tax=Nesterenkonia alba TaxID=515814 RepID=UPI0003B692CB|nr:ABC transporter permease [Nesterenkonia alba]
MNPNIATGVQRRPHVFEVDPTLPGVSFLGVLRSELTKLLTLRTTFWLCSISLGISLLAGLAVGVTAGTLDNVLGDESTIIAQAAVSGMYFVMILLGALGVIAFTTEFTTGAIRSTLTAVPRRGVLYTAKLLALILITGAVTAVILVLTHLLTAVLTEHLPLLSVVTNSEVAMLYLSTWVTVLTTAVLGFGLGLLLRSSAGGIVVLTVLLFVVDFALALLFGFTQADWVETVNQFQYNYFVGEFTRVDESLRNLAPPLALLGLIGWAAVPNIAGLVTFIKRDA